MRSTRIITIVIVGLALVMSCHKKQDHEIVYPEVPVYNIEGNVFDSYSENPLENVKVELFTADSTLLTDYSDANGHFEFEGLYAEDYINLDYMVRYYIEGYENAEIDIVFDGGNLQMQDKYLMKTLLIVDSYSVYSKGISGITWDGSNFWTCNETTEKLYKHDTDFNIIEEFSDIIPIPRGMAFGDEKLWVASKNNDFFVVAFDNTMQAVDSVKMKFFAGLAYVPALDLTNKGQYLISCDILSDYFKIYDYQLKSVSDHKYNSIADPSGVIWDGSYYFIIAMTCLYKTNESFEPVDKYLIPVSGLNYLTFDGYYYYGCVNDESESIVYKLQDIH